MELDVTGTEMLDLCDKRKNELQESFWTQFTQIEKLFRFYSLFYFFVFWLPTLLLPTLLVIDCVDGHKYISHILEGIVAILLVNFDFFWLYKRQLLRMETKARPEAKALQIVFAESKRNFFRRIQHSLGIQYMKNELISVVGHLDIYCDICFIAIAKESEDEILWRFSAILMALTSFPKLYTLFRFQWNCFYHRKEYNEDIPPSRNVSYMMNPGIPDAYKRLAFLINFLHANELKGPSKELSEFCHNHKIFVGEHIGVNSKPKKNYYIWKFCSEDLPQMILQIIYLCMPSVNCPERDSINEIIIISVIFSLLMSASFVLAAIYSASTNKLISNAIKFEINIDNTRFQSLQKCGTKGELPPDILLEYLSRSVPNEPSICALSLDGIGIGDQGVSYLAITIKNSSHIRKILLTNNLITNNGAEILLDAMQAQGKIRAIDLNGNNEITERGMIKLFSFSFPRIEVHNADPNLVDSKGRRSIFALSGRHEIWSFFLSLQKCEKPFIEILEMNLNIREDERINLNYEEEVKTSYRGLYKLRLASNLTEIRITGSAFVFGQIEELFKEIPLILSLRVLFIAQVEIKINELEILGEVLAQNKNRDFQKLILIRTHISNHGIYKLCKGITKNCTLKKLELTLNNFGDEGAYTLGEGFKHNKHLEKIHLEENNITEEGALAIRNGIMSAPTEVFCFCLIHEDNVIQNSLIINPLSITLKKIGKSVIANEGIYHALMDFIHNSKVQNLNLNLNEKCFNQEELKQICYNMSAKTNLRTLKLQNNNMGEASGEYIKHLLEQTISLKNLYLKSNEIGHGVNEIMKGLKINNSLINLDLSRCNLQKEDAVLIGTYLKTNGNLQELDLSFNLILDIGAEAIGGSLKENTHLQVLRLESNKITNKGACKFADNDRVDRVENANGLLYNKSIIHLDIGQNHIQDEGVKAICIALRAGERIQTLNFSDTDLTNASVEELVKLLEQSSFLVTLKLGRNQIRDIDVQLIASAISRHCVSLAKIDFSNVQCIDPADRISNMGARELLKMIKVQKTVTELNLKGNPISRLIIDQLTIQLNENKSQLQ